MRAVLAAIGTGPIETYESPAETLDAMPKSALDLVIAGAAIQPMTGPQLVRAMRRSNLGPLSLVLAADQRRPPVRAQGRARCRCWHGGAVFDQLKEDVATLYNPRKMWVTPH
jgi:DNA-binding NarL/FixJ family response regulator